jgi:hypothetical protein
MKDVPFVSVEMTMRVIIIFASLVIATAAAAQAQPSNAATDSKILSDCLKKTDDAGDFGAASCTKKAESDVAKSKACAHRVLLLRKLGNAVNEH